MMFGPRFDFGGNSRVAGANWAASFRIWVNCSLADWNQAFSFPFPWFPF